MKAKIKVYFESLNPKKIGLKGKVKVSSISKLGMGTGNMNYLVVANRKKFVFRMNMALTNKNKSRKEYNSLKIVEKYNLGPKTWILDESRKLFDSDFIILGYLEGKTVDKTRDYFKLIMIKKIARLCADMHSVKMTNRLQRLDHEDSIKGLKEYHSNLKNHFINYINKHLRNKIFYKIIIETYRNLEKSIPSGKFIPDIVLSQGDFCEQNVIVDKGIYKLIDFEDLELTDRASQLAHLFTDFGKPFNNEQRKLFMDVYCRITKQDKKELSVNINYWIPLKLFTVFLWSIYHILKIKNKEMHSEFLENDDMGRNLNYAQIMLNRCIKFGVIDKKYKGLDIKRALMK